MKIFDFLIFSSLSKNEKTPETLDFTGFSGGVFGVPGAIRTRGLSLRRRTLYPAELRRRTTPLSYTKRLSLSTAFAMYRRLCAAKDPRSARPLSSS